MAIVACDSIMLCNCWNIVTDPILFAACRDCEAGIAGTVSAAAVLGKAQRGCTRMDGELIQREVLAPVGVWRRIIARTLVVLIAC